MQDRRPQKEPENSLKSALVAHCQRRLTSDRNHGPDLHVELLKYGGIRSFSLAENFEDNGGARLENFDFRRKAPSLVQRNTERIRDRFFPSVRRSLVRAWYRERFKDIRPDLVHAHFGYVG